MTKTLLMIAGAVILAAYTPIVSWGETGQGSPAPQGFDTPAKVGKSSFRSSAVTLSGTSSGGAARTTEPPASQRNTPAASASPLGIQTDKKGSQTSGSGLVSLLSGLLPTQEDLVKAFDSPLFAAGRARLPEGRWNSGTK